jgi:uncharacterized membrane protein YdjX (TVP38/TMEM64 family)
MPLVPGAPARVGLGLWTHPTTTAVIEVIMYAVGVTIYARATRAIDRRGRYGLWALVVTLLLLYAVSIVSPPPPTVKALAAGALIGWPLSLWPWWVDRHRRVNESSSTAASASM